MTLQENLAWLRGYLAGKDADQVAFDTLDEIEEAFPKQGGGA